MRRLALAVPLLAALSASPSVAAEPEGQRWPLWPTELSQRSAPLLRRGLEEAPESDRRDALHALVPYANPLVEPILLQALEDLSPQIRRDALQACAYRQMTACIETARRLWADPVGDLSGRLYALRVMLLEPSSEHVGAVLSALRATTPLLRAEAARLLGVTALSDRDDPRVRAALIAKLADPDAEVRRAVARSLGLLAAREATLVLARMLEDPDPQLRRDAAESLGMIGDPRSLPAMLRALDRGDEVYVARALLDGLVRQGGAEVDARLLELLDSPPRGLKIKQIAQLLGTRESPSPEYLDGLLQRLRQESLRDDLLDTLLHLGDEALPAIEAMLARGVEPELAVELERLVRARRLPTEATATPPPPPPAEDRSAWHRQLERENPGRLQAAADLGKLSPPWLGAAIAGALAASTDAIGDRAWLVALATSTEPPSDVVMWAGILSRAEESRRSVADRCLAIAALGRMPKSAREAFASPLLASAADPRVGIRTCAALALSGSGEASSTLAALLEDPSPRVRAAAALALSHTPTKEREPISTQLAAVELDDADGRVRMAAKLRRRPAPQAAPPALLVTALADPRAPGWMTVELAQGELQIPSQSFGLLAWALVPDDRIRPLSTGSTGNATLDDAWIE